MSAMNDSAEKPFSNAFSVDVEDGISIAMRDRFDKRIPQTDRVVSLTRKLLDMMARHEVRGTFFVLGQVAETFPGLVREIQSAGHEIGVHGHDHHVFHKLTPTQAREELSRAKSVLEDVTGQRMVGHRAPAFSVDSSTAWVLDLLLDLGFKYDSSIMPCQGVGYGWPGQTIKIGKICTPSGRKIVEVPMSVITLGGRRVPALGGSYFRLLPLAISRRLFRRIQDTRPVIMYLHPYEVDAESYPDFYFAELAKVQLKTRLRMRSFWLRRKSLLTRYNRLLGEFEFRPIAELPQVRELLAD